MDIVWLKSAFSDLDAIESFIEMNNPVAARVIERKIIATVGHLTNQPSLGRPGRVDGTRELVIPATPYIAAYTVIANKVVILAVLHGARRWPKSF